jgi:hypothetical protein
VVFILHAACGEDNDDCCCASDDNGDGYFRIKKEVEIVHILRLLFIK